MITAKRVKTTTVLVACITAGFVAGVVFADKSELFASDMARPKAMRLGQRDLTNPLLACESEADVLKSKQLRPFKSEIEELIARKVASGVITKASVYFRGLNDGMTFNIKAGEGYEPASLIKVPLMMVILKRAEANPGILKQKLTYDGKRDWNEGSYFKPRQALVAGTSYTVEELISRMIGYSDNNAYWMLLENLKGATSVRDEMQKLHNDLGIDIIPGPSGAGLVTVKSYSIFLRVLYNASYLNEEMSNMALSFLALEEFHEGINASVPPDVVVAGKFGERSTGANGEIKQLHDFGIVYYQNKPYMLSIMTEGRDFDQLSTVLREISKDIFEKVARHQV